MPRLNKRNYDYTRKCTFFLSKNPDTSAEVLHSETFETEDLDGTRWQLVFYTKGHSFRNYTSLYLQRASCDTNIEKIFVDFSFECERNRTYVEFQNICFDRHHCWGSPVFSQIPSRKTDNTFEIFIRMSKSKVLSEIDVQNLKNDLEALSQDLLDILQYGQLSDLRLSCVRNQFLTHKCILAARCPKLVSIGMENISLEILRVILVYIYSAKLIIPNVRISAELYIVTMKLEMTDLIQKMHNHPYFSSLDPEFNVDHLKFDWEVNSELLKTQPCSRTYPTKKIYTNKLIIACEIKKDNDDFYLFVSFHFDTFNTDMPIFLDYRIEESSCGRVTLLGCESHMFFKNEIWESRINKNFCKLPKVFQLICHIDLFDEVKFISNHRDRIIHVKTAQNYSYYNRFPVDMLRFLKSEFLSDFTMISYDKKEFKVHRAILAARSSVFQRMLNHTVKETITGRVEIDDIDSATLQLMISYIYSGMIYNLDLEETLKLYIAADKYDIQSLVMKCSSLILSNINSETLDNVISFADSFNYRELKNLIRDRDKPQFSLQVLISNFSDAEVKYLSF